MTPPSDKPATDDPRIYFAAERTLLAWVRTGLAMMGFGFVVARFGLFLREIAAARGLPAANNVGLSLWFGVALLLFGVGVTLLSAFGYWRTIERLDRSEPLRFKKLSLSVISALGLAVLGLAMALYLTFGLNEPR